jgi:hypothetical protein
MLIAADTDGAARRLATSLQQVFLNLIGGRGELQRADHGRAGDGAARRGGVTGEDGGPTKIISSEMIFDPVARMRSYAIVAEVWAGGE